MPISDQQLAANRANAQKSHGPTTIEGKKKSSQNARRLPYVPAQDGFVFSNTEIDRHTDRFHRLKLAEDHGLTYRKQAKLYELPCLPKQAA